MAKDLILAMGAPPKLGAKQGAPRAFMKQYKGALTPDRPDSDSEDTDDDNTFDDEKDASPDEMLIGCAQNVMAAQHSRNPEEFADALKAFVQMC